MKKSKTIITILVVLLIMSIISIIFLVCKINKDSKSKVNQEISKDAFKFKYDYEELNGITNSNGDTYNNLTIDINNPMKYVNLEELVNIINTEDNAIVYISSPTCPYCRATVETLLEVAKKLNINKIYYYDAFKEKDITNYDELMKKLEEKEVVSIDESGKYFWGIPKLLEIKNGNVVSKANGVTYKLDNGQSRYDSLTDEQKKIVYDRYYQNLESYLNEN